MTNIRYLKTRMDRYEKANPVNEFAHLSDEQLAKRIQDLEAHLDGLGCYRPLSLIADEMEVIKLEHELAVMGIN